MLERLLGVLLIEALRCGSDTASPPSVARELSDNQLVAASRAVHAQPAYGWTVANLAAEAAMWHSPFFRGSPVVRLAAFSVTPNPAVVT